MIPTSLDVAGFASAEGNLSSPSSSFGSRSQDWASDAQDQGSSFRQVMNSYSRSDGDSSEESKPRASRRSDSEEAARTNEAATAADQQTSPPPATSFTGNLGFRKTDGEDQESSAENTAQASAETTEAGENSASATPKTGAAAQITGLSAMQMLLNGGSLTQILAANSAPSNGQVGPEGGTADVNAKTGGDTTKGAAGKSLSVELAGAASAKAAKLKSDNSKLVDLKRKREASGTAAADLQMLVSNNTALIEPASKEAAGDEDRSAKEGLAEITGSAHESLQLSAAADSENAAKAAANNFAFAVRLTGEGADAAAHTESNGGLGQGPVALAAAEGQHGVAALAAEMAGTAAHNGEHSGEAPNESAMMFAGESAPDGRTAHSESASAAEDATPAEATDAEPATQTEPVRNVRLQLEGENNQRVDIRLVDVGGEMRVSVRAGDTKLAQTLQEHIPDLASRLDQQRFRAEIWSPRTESASQSNSANVAGQSSRGGDSQGEGGQRRQGNGRQQQNQPDWVDELENYSSRTTTTRRSNQLWPQ